MPAAGCYFKTCFYGFHCQDSTVINRTRQCYKIEQHLLEWLYDIHSVYRSVGSRVETQLRRAEVSILACLEIMMYLTPEHFLLIILPIEQ
jgi:hypothetical protein